MLNVKAEEEAIVRWVCSAYGLSPEELCGRDRTHPLAEARVVAYCLARRRGMSYPRIGRMFGRDSSTIVTCCRVGERLLKTDVQAMGLLAKFCAEREAFDTESLLLCAVLPPDKVPKDTGDSPGNGVEKVDETGGNAGGAPSPLASPLPAPSGSGSVISYSDPTLSSGSKPESKRARGPKPRLRHVPETWQPSDAHRALALELSVDFEQQLALFRDHEFKDPKSNFDAAFRTWLRRANDYAPRKLNGTPPGLEQHNVHKQAAGAELARRLLTGGRRP